MRKNIAPFITYKEYGCSHCRRLPPLFYHSDGGRMDTVPTVYEPLFDAFKDIRTRWGRPITINSGFRCIKRQRELYDQGISSAVISVHNFGLALDLDCDNEREVRSMVKLIKTYYSELRIGWKGYLYKGQTFVHIDMGYMIRPIYSKKLYRGNEW